MSAEPFVSYGPEGTQDKKLLVKIVRAPIDVPEARIPQIFQLSEEQTPPWSDPDAVRTRGVGIRDTLFSLGGIGTVLRNWGAANAHDPTPLYIQLSEPMAESINWEVMFHQNNFFVSLDRRWPIARLTDPLNERSQPQRLMFKQIRFMVLISACKVETQVSEWESIRNAVISGRKQLDIQLHVVVGSEELRASIETDISQMGMGDFCIVSSLGDSGGKVVAKILDWSPNLLHFFCHGFADEFNQYLELAKETDYIQELDRGSIRLDVKELQVIASQLDNPWCIALNCCSSAESLGIQSMACRVVEAGFPCAVAMVEPVDAGDAYEFSEAFYPPLFRALWDATQKLKSEPRAQFEWTDAMYWARKAIAARHESNQRKLDDIKEWAIPVMYVRGLEQFYFSRAQDLDASLVRDYVTRSKVVADWLKTAAGGADEATRTQMIRTILADVPEAFWPRPDGSYVGGL